MAGLIEDSVTKDTAWATQVHRKTMQVRVVDYSAFPKNSQHPVILPQKYLKHF